jgi:hypothetical protein
LKSAYIEKFAVVYLVNENAEYCVRDVVAPVLGGWRCRCIPGIQLEKIYTDCEECAKGFSGHKDIGGFQSGYSSDIVTFIRTKGELLVIAMI